MFVFQISQRTSIGLDIIRDRNQLYRETSGLIENIYTLKLINKDEQDRTFDIKAEGIDDLILLVDKSTILVEAGTVYDLPVRLRAKEENLNGRSTEVRFTLSVPSDDDLSITEVGKFSGANTIMLNNESQQVLPWYKESYVWLLIFFPLLAVIGGIVTTILAVQSDDGLVVDDYYKQGLEINRTLERDQVAVDYNLDADIH